MLSKLLLPKTLIEDLINIRIKENIHLICKDLKKKFRYSNRSCAKLMEGINNMMKLCSDQTVIKNFVILVTVIRIGVSFEVCSIKYEEGTKICHGFETLWFYK